MRLGAPILEPYDSPEAWVHLVRSHGYRAAYSPLRGNESDAEIDRYARAAREADIVIAEQGAWRCNCLSPDAAQRRTAVALCAERLAVAERLGARCCVSLSGSRGERWAGPHPDNLSEETFALVVENTRKILDLVKPQHTDYTLEAMPWTFPDSAQCYERLLHAVDRPHFAVHYDPVNLVYSPDRYFHSGRYIADFLRRLGGHIRACHVKDVALLDQYVFYLEERIPGDGCLDYTALLRGLTALDPDLPIMMEHLAQQTQYDRGAAFLRAKAAKLGLSL